MGNSESKIMRRRLRNAYLSSIISISLVLLLVGIASLLLVNARAVSDYFKENMQVSVMMKQSVSDDAALSYKASLDKERFIKSTVFVIPVTKRITLRIARNLKSLAKIDKNVTRTYPFGLAVTVKLSS